MRTPAGAGAAANASKEEERAGSGEIRLQLACSVLKPALNLLAAAIKAEQDTPCAKLAVDPAVAAVWNCCDGSRLLSTACAGLQAVHRLQAQRTLSYRQPDASKPASQ